MRTYRSYDFYINNTSEFRPTYINHLQFHRFLQILVDELKYNVRINILFYTLKIKKRVYILNKRV